jgi:hypothetical protein
MHAALSDPLLMKFVALCLHTGADLGGVVASDHVSYHW